MNIYDYGYRPTELTDDGYIPARVTAVHRERYELFCDRGECYGRLKASQYYRQEELYPTAGDFVMIDYQVGGDSVIVRTLERRSLFSRLDPSSSGHAAQAVAANFDYVFILQSLNHDFNPRRLERYITLAWQSRALPVVVLTKADLVEDAAPMRRQAEQAAAGVGVYAVSAKSGAGLDDLSEYLRPGKTCVFLGSSGVGKSSLVNALAGSEVMDTSEIREDDSRGRHTTTHRQLIMLPSGVMIIDTPGMRELGMWDVSEGIGQSFADVESYFGSCKFRDCTHNGEPGCAVQAAIDRGELSAERLESYRRLRREARFSDDKDGYMRGKEAWAKGIAMYNRKNGPKK